MTFIKPDHLSPSISNPFLHCTSVLINCLPAYFSSVLCHFSPYIIYARPSHTLYSLNPALQFSLLISRLTFLICLSCLIQPTIILSTVFLSSFYAEPPVSSLAFLFAPHVFSLTGSFIQYTHHFLRLLFTNLCLVPSSLIFLPVLLHFCPSHLHSNKSLNSSSVFFPSLYPTFPLLLLAALYTLSLSCVFLYSVHTRPPQSSSLLKNLHFCPCLPSSSVSHAF